MQDQEEDYLDKTYNLIKEYSDDRILLLKIQAAKKSGKIISKLVFVGIASLLLFFLLLFVSIMLGYYFADMTGSMYKGFGIVAGIYLAVFLLFLALFKSVISKKVMNMTTDIFFEDTNDLDFEDDEE